MHKLFKEKDLEFPHSLAWRLRKTYDQNSPWPQICANGKRSPQAIPPSDR
jgi:hypothetical protein